MIQKPPLEALTGLRFLAALAVFNLHFLHLADWFTWVPAPILSIVSAGDKGVTLFFMLSGFILAYAYEGIKTDTPSRVKFWINRFSRIYPVYLLAWLWSAPIFLVLRFESEPLALAVQKSVAAGVPSLLLLQAWIHPRLAIAWNGPGWTLSVEAFFYLVFPFAAIGIRKLTQSRLVLAVAVLLILSGGLSYFSADGRMAESTLARYLHIHPLPNLPIFLAGVALGYHFQRGRIGGRAADCCAVVGALLCLLCAAIPSSTAGLLAYHFGFLPAIALVIYGVASGGGPSRILKSRIMVALGEASYAFYILQFSIGVTVDYLAVAAFGPAAYARLQGSPLYFLGLLTIAVVVSSVVYRTVETPMRILVQKFLNGRLVIASSAKEKSPEVILPYARQSQNPP
jgi:peptidoglycan/LPS O-acetylase OafA/YrhL